jgi:Cft2 family RNA processing exonuclease
LSTVTFTAIGGGSEIGANSYLIHADGHEVLLDCGIHPKKEGFESLPEFSLLRRPPQAVIISHGHIDHCGSLPYLLKEFPGSPCYATIPTVSIMDRMLHNSVSVMGTLAVERGIEEYPLYTHADVDYALRRCCGLRFSTEFALSAAGPFRATFHPAGHVLGSACVLLRTPGHTVFYTGDICVSPQELMGGYVPLNHKVKVDTLVIESTRGMHEGADEITFEGEVSRFAREATKVIEGGGCVLTPSFALGRTQELLNIISRLQESGEIPAVPVYASGLGRAIYEIYSKYTDYLREDALLRPLYEFERIGDVWDRSVRKKLLRDPAIIVATSGMMVENTPSALLAMEMVQHRRHGIFFVGYLDPETLGYRLGRAQVGDKLVFELGGPAVTIQLDNRQRFNFSAHATREDLCQLIEAIAPQNVIFVHGDPDASAWMLANTNNVAHKYIPTIGKTISLDA